MVGESPLRVGISLYPSRKAQLHALWICCDEAGVHHATAGDHITIGYSEGVNVPSEEIAVAPSRPCGLGSTGFFMDALALLTDCRCDHYGKQHKGGDKKSCADRARDEYTGIAAGNQ